MLSYLGCHIMTVHWLYWNSWAWSSSDVIIMLKWRHHVMSHLNVFKNCLETFLNIKCDIKWWARRRTDQLYEDGIKIYIPQHHRLSSLCKPSLTKLWSSGHTFLAHPTMDCLTIFQQWIKWLSSNNELRDYLPTMSHVTVFQKWTIWLSFNIASRDCLPTMNYVTFFQQWTMWLSSNNDLSDCLPIKNYVSHWLSSDQQWISWPSSNNESLNSLPTMNYVTFFQQLIT